MYNNIVFIKNIGSLLRIIICIVITMLVMPKTIESFLFLNYNCSLEITISTIFIVNILIFLIFTLLKIFRKESSYLKNFITMLFIIMWVVIISIWFIKFLYHTAFQSIIFDYCGILIKKLVWTKKEMHAVYLYNIFSLGYIPEAKYEDERFLFESLPNPEVLRENLLLRQTRPEVSDITLTTLMDMIKICDSNIKANNITLSSLIELVKSSNIVDLNCSNKDEIKYSPINIIQREVEVNSKNDPLLKTDTELNFDSGLHYVRAGLILLLFGSFIFTVGQFVPFVSFTIVR